MTRYALQKGKIFDNGSQCFKPEYVHECVVSLYSKVYRTTNIQTIMLYMNAEDDKSLNHLYRCIAKETKLTFN